jgi:hypothetical protein
MLHSRRPNDAKHLGTAKYKWSDCNRIWKRFLSFLLFFFLSFFFFIILHIHFLTFFYCPSKNSWVTHIHIIYMFSLRDNWSLVVSYRHSWAKSFLSNFRFVCFSSRFFSFHATFSFLNPWRGYPPYYSFFSISAPQGNPSPWASLSQFRRFSIRI